MVRAAACGGNLQCDKWHHRWTRDTMQQCWRLKPSNPKFLKDWIDFKEYLIIDSKNSYKVWVENKLKERIERLVL